MASGPYKTFALAGAGTLGTHVLKAFSAKGVPITLLTRSSGSKLAPELASLPHVTVRAVDYSSHSDLVAALRGIDVVVSTLGDAGYPLQTGLADAAKEAGVKLFVPSEFGVASPGWTDETAVLFPKKITVHNHLKKIDLPYALFITGAFSEWAAIFTGFAASGYRSAFVAGTGDGIASWTSLQDIGRFVVYAVTSLPVDQVEWKEFRIEGDRKSTNQLIGYLSKKVGRDIPTDHWDLAATKASSLKERKFFPDFIISVIEEGHLSVQWDQVHQKAGVPNSNSLFPHWNPKSLEQVIDGLDLK